MVHDRLVKSFNEDVPVLKHVTLISLFVIKGIEVLLAVKHREAPHY